MRCSRVQYLYEDYVIGVLPDATMARIDDHLAACAECRDFFETNDDVADLILQGNEVVHPGDGYLNDLSARILAELGRGDAAPGKTRPAIVAAPARPWNRPLWWGGGFAAAALVAAVLAGGDPPEHPRRLAELRATDAGDPYGIPRYGVTVGRAGQTLVRPLPVDSAGSGAGWASFGEFPTDGHSLSKSALDERRSRDEARAEAPDRLAAVFTLMTFQANEGEPPPADRERAPATRLNLGINPPAEFVEGLARLDALPPDQRREEAVRLVRRLRGEERETELDPVFQQAWGAFWNAEAAVREGRFDDALPAFEELIAGEPDSLFAHRSRLRLANLAFDEFGDFARADALYRECLAEEAAFSFTETELAHVRLRLQILDRFSVNDWRALGLMHDASRGDWPEVVAAVSAMTAHPEARYLLPEASRIVSERLRAGRRIENAATAAALARALEAALEPLRNSTSKTWILLALGDALRYHGLDAAAARRHYSEVLQVEQNSPVADRARVGLEALGEP